MFLSVALLPASAFAYGESDENGVPSREERLLLVLSNQVRQAPHQWPNWDTTLATSAARSALASHDGLMRAARFHADDMARNNFFSHDSSDGTSFSTRLSRYFSGPAGENIYGASFGDAEDAITAWMNSNEGHRENLLDTSWTFLGTGFALQAGDRLYVQDFGQQRGAAIPRIPAGSWRARAAKIELIANFFDPSRAAPTSFRASIGDRCEDLEAIAGPPGNQTAAVEIEAPSSCTPLVFVAIDGDGARVEYPDSGAIMVGSNCAAEFDAKKRPSGCGVGPGTAGPAIPSERGGCSTTGEAGLPPAALCLVLLAFSCSRTRRR